MDRFLYLAMNGASQAQLAQRNNANNLANISTTGFRAALDHFETRAVTGPGYHDRAYASNEQSGANFNPGAVVTTGRDLDLAINGDGWFAVQAPDGSTAYSRRGDFRIDPAGLLKNGADQIVLGEAGPIIIPQFETLEVGRDGTISVRAAGQAANTLVAVDRLRLVNPPREQLIRAMVECAGVEQCQRGRRDGADDGLRALLRTTGQADEDRQRDRLGKRPPDADERLTSLLIGGGETRRSPGLFPPFRVCG